MSTVLVGALPLAIALPCLVLSRDWRLTLSALALLFLGCSLLEWAVAGPVVGLLRLILGQSVVAALLVPRLASLTRPTDGLRAAPTSLPASEAEPPALRTSSDEAFRLFLLLLALVASYATSQLAPLSFTGVGNAGTVTFFVYWVAAVGLLLLVHSRDVLRLGAGVLLLLMAANLLHSALASPGLASLMAGASLLLIVAAIIGRAEGRG